MKTPWSIINDTVDELVYFNYRQRNYQEEAEALKKVIEGRDESPAALAEAVRFLTLKLSEVTVTCTSLQRAFEAQKEAQARREEFSQAHGQSTSSCPASPDTTGPKQLPRSSPASLPSRGAKGLHSRQRKSSRASASRKVGGAA